MSSVILVITNCPNRAIAEQIGTSLVAEGLAACVIILADCTSIYQWEGKLTQSTEVPLLIKTTLAAYPKLESALTKLHPYDVPEIIAIPVSAGLPAYLNWVETETRKSI